MDGVKRNDVVQKEIRRCFKVTKWDLFMSCSGGSHFFLFEWISVENGGYSNQVAGSLKLEGRATGQAHRGRVQSVPAFFMHISTRIR